jgi:pimeloyl-ACP methyl ester carboxylesterase
MTEFFTASDGTKIAYRDDGAGTPLLCLAGLTRTMADFDYVAPHLAGVRMIRMDYRGRGASDWTGAASYNLPQESRDVVNLLDHLALDRVAVLGTSRGGVIGMVLAATAKDRLLGLCLNDVGPEIDQRGLDRIIAYVGRNPAARTFAEMAKAMPRNMPGFAHVPQSRWQAEAEKHYIQTETGLKITYDPALRDLFAAPAPVPFDAWPLFDALAGLPIALIRGANSDLLSAQTAEKMRARRPDMIFGSVPDRAHIPFLDEPESLAVIRSFLAALA